MRFHHAITGLFFSLALVTALAQPTSRTFFAAGATDLSDAVTVRSPDGKKSVTGSYNSEQGSFSLRVRFGSVDLSESIGPGGSELEWSQDSKAFFVSTSDQGANGWYHTFVYFVTKDGIKRIDPTPAVLAAFGQPVKCGWPEDPNVAGINWLADSQHILIAAEIMHHSNCDSFGTFKAYEVALPELKIVKTYNQLEAKKLFSSSLGEELRDAPDNCIRDPKSCELPANHRSDH